MTTQYTSILKLALPVTGELSGTWGDVVNDNITSMVEEAIAGLATINSWSSNSHTLTTANGTSAEARCAMLVLTDTGTALTGAATVVCPTSSKIYIVKNDCGQTATIQTSGGTGVAIPDGDTMFVFCDGTNVVQAVTRLIDADVSFTTLKGTGAVIVTNILDEDDMASDSATALATQQSIKAYVDAQISANNDLSEVLANGNTTGGTDLAVSAGDDITFTDTSKAIFGTDGDLEVYHDGSNAYAVNATGSLIVDTAGLTVQNAAGTETMLTATENGAVSLYYDNAARVTTTSAGVDIAGGINATGAARLGVLNTDTSLTTYGTGNLTLSTNEGTNSGTIVIAQGVDGNITLTPDGAGYVSVPNLLVSGGTANGVAYLNGSKVLTSGSALTFDGTTLGVTASGLSVVTLGDTGSSTDQKYWNWQYGTGIGAGLLRLRAGNDAGTDGQNAYIIARTGINVDNHQWLASGTERMRLTSTGLGIGTSSPAAKLEIHDSTDASITLRNTSAFVTNTGPHIDFQGYDSTSVIKTFAKVYGVSKGSNDGEFYITTRNAGVLTERLRIDSSGNVGIGTSSPLGKLHVETQPSGAGITPSVNGDELVLENNSNCGLTIGTENLASIFFGKAADSDIGGIGYAMVDNSMRFTTNAAERMRLDSSGNLGLGVTPSAWGGSGVKAFDIGSAGGIAGSGSDVGVIANAYYNGSSWIYKTSSLAARYQILVGTGSHTWYTAPSGTAGNAISFTQAMTLSAIGDLSIGTTVAPYTLTTSNSSSTVGAAVRATGYLTAARDSDYALQLNRITTDGIIAQFRKDGVPVGGIGAFGGNAYFGNGDTGIRPNSATDAIYPITVTGGGAARDAAISLGDSGTRFKDLYLSGGVYVGGTGAANHLDDYEEGTWTPVIEGSTSAGSYTYTNGYGYYTKIGQQVTVTFNLTNITQVSAGTGYMQIKGLPFAKSSGVTYNGSLRLTSAILSVGTTWCTLEFISGSASSIIYVLQMGSGSAGVDFPVSSISSGATDVTGTITYIV